MKKVMITGIILLIYSNAISQQPVHWNYYAKMITDKEFELHIVALIDEHWHTYSQTTPEGGPAPTKIIFLKNPLITLKGKTNEKGDLHRIHDNTFGVDVKYFDNKAEFVQIVNLKSNAKTKQAGTIEFMVCNDHECLPPKTISFSISLNPNENN